eukprot:CAMPEP_0184545790 /NCGR_PEP_ID=MMETSP0199_2-20130426/4550_1 /TAXON_ID=1112570 /ORGANISM="Thraustochytrium sp., Strain LLF1b" /LENGTH=622 /DNA_ID=CAMNT_0026940135 /DNA_START=217 /DNA_END=2082 /DNA_ORIENTATION=-
MAEAGDTLPQTAGGNAAAASTKPEGELEKAAAPAETGTAMDADNSSDKVADEAKEESVEVRSNGKSDAEGAVPAGSAAAAASTSQGPAQAKGTTNTSSTTKPEERKSTRNEDDGYHRPDPVVKSDCGEEKARFDHAKALFTLETLPLARSSALEGIGGMLKEEPAFFNVDEINLEFDPVPAGTVDNLHAMVRIRRSGIDTKGVVKRMAQIFDCRVNEIGYAGLKDKKASTSQVFSLQLQRSYKDDNEVTEALNKIKAAIEADTEEPRLHVIGDVFAGLKKLKPGMLKGNRFQILITQMEMPLEEAFAAAEKIKADLLERYVPNYFGPQRVGRNGRTCLEGYRLVRHAEIFLEETRGSQSSASETNTPNAQTVTSSEHTAPGNETTEAVPTATGATPTNGAAVTGASTLSAVKEGEGAPAQAQSRKRKHEPTRKDYFRWLRKKKARVKAFKCWSETFKLHAFQSGVFNHLLRKRIDSGFFATDLVGDLVRHEYGSAKGRFVETESDVPTKDERDEGFAFSLPLIGPKYRYREGTPSGKLEFEALSDLPVEGLALGFAGLELSRRVGRLSVKAMDICIEKVVSPSEWAAAKFPDEDLNLEVDGAGLLFSFTLPSGSYATSVLRE